MQSTLWSIMVRERVPEILICILDKGSEEIYTSIIAREINMTLSHIVKLLKYFEATGLINVEAHGRIKVLSLTKTGREIAEHFKKIKEISKSKVVLVDKL